MNKKTLREKMIFLRKQLSNDDISEKSLKIHNKLKNDALFVQSKNVMLYMSFNGEIETKSLILWCMENNKNVYLPVMQKNRQMLAVKAEKNDFSDLIQNSFGIYEPSGTSCADVQDFDLIIAPMVAADTKKNRLGYGGGYYDKFLQNTTAPVYGICYDFQILPNGQYLTCEPHDKPMSKVFSEIRSL